MNRSKLFYRNGSLINSRNRLHYRILMTAVSLLITSCAPPPTIPPPPTAISLPTAYNNNVAIRLDSVTIKQDDGDGGSGGEVYFAILVTREQGESAKLVLPGNNTFHGTLGQEIEPGDFSLAVNNVKFSQDEKISIYFIGFENDSQNFRDETLTNLALAVALDLAKKHIPGGPLVPYILEMASGPALDWWREEEVLGEYSTVLNKDNKWLVGKQYHVISTNGNLEIDFTVIQNLDALGVEPIDKVTLMVVNNTASPIERLYISNMDCPEKDTTICPWGANLLKESIQAGGTQVVLVPVGTYDVRVESANHFWEKSALDLTINQKWVITSNQ